MNDSIKRLDLALHGGGLVAVISLVGAVWWFVYRPLEEARGEALARCQEINELLSNADRLRSEQADLRRFLTDARQQEEALLARVPGEAHEADFLRQISHLAKDVGVVLRDYRPGQVSSQANCSAMDITLACEGSYEALCRFLGGVGNLPRLVNLATLDIDGSQGSGVYTAAVKLVIYFAADGPVAERTGAHG